MLWFYGNDHFLHFLAFTKTADKSNENEQCHMTFRGLSGVWAKLEPARSDKNDEILEINVLRKFTLHAPHLLTLLPWILDQSKVGSERLNLNETGKGVFHFKEV